MSPETLFTLANTLALAGWVALPPTFLLGPLGLLVFFGLRAARR